MRRHRRVQPNRLAADLDRVAELSVRDRPLPVLVGEVARLRVEQASALTVAVAGGAMARAALLNVDQGRLGHARERGAADRERGAEQQSGRAATSPRAKLLALVRDRVLFGMGEPSNRG